MPPAVNVNVNVNVNVRRTMKALRLAAVLPLPPGPVLPPAGEVLLGRPDACERHAGRAERAADRLRVGGFELADHAPAVERQVAAEPLHAVRVEAGVEALRLAVVGLGREG